MLFSSYGKAKEWGAHRAVMTGPPAPNYPSLSHAWVHRHGLYIGLYVATVPTLSGYRGFWRPHTLLGLDPLVLPGD